MGESGMGTNPYQKRTVTLREVADRIVVPDDVPKPRILLSVSPCRSGTTVLLRVFGATGIQSHYQELKNILRWRMQAEEWHWQVPAGQSVIYLKETLGPYTLAEANFNPLQVLLKSGVSPKDITVFIVGRDPLETWASWTAWWREVTSLDIFIQAYRTTEEIRIQAQKEGFLAATFVYDAIRDIGAEKAVRALFSKLGLAFTPIAVRGWQGLPPFGVSGSQVILPKEPPVFNVPGLHAQVEKADRLSYYDRNGELCELHPHECERIVWLVAKPWGELFNQSEIEICKKRNQPHSI
jgi:hypothetical protein